MIAWHVSDTTKLASIMQNGVRGGAYLTTNSDVIAYYLEAVEDEGRAPVLIKMDLSGLPDGSFAPDKPGLDEPITTALGKSEEEIWSEWEHSDKTWNACLEIIGSFRCMVHVPPHSLSIVTVDDCVLQPETQMLSVAQI